jgi:hypothetical protein
MVLESTVIALESGGYGLILDAGQIWERFGLRRGSKSSEEGRGGGKE